MRCCVCSGNGPSGAADAAKSLRRTKWWPVYPATFRFANSLPDARLWQLFQRTGRNCRLEDVYGPRQFFIDNVKVARPVDEVGKFGVAI